MRILVALTTVVLLAACTTESVPTEEPAQTEPTGQPTPEAPTEEQMPAAEKQDFRLMSTAFLQEDSIPAIYSCDGKNISPGLTWTNPLDITKSFALIMDDPDAPVGTWVHWVLFNLPPETRSLPEAVGPDPTLANGAVHGSNSWEAIGYGGPCPPSGEHRYFFKLYALDNVLELEVGATKEQVLEAMEGHILAQTELMGTYSR